MSEYRSPQLKSLFDGLHQNSDGTISKTTFADFLERSNLPLDSRQYILQHVSDNLSFLDFTHLVRKLSQSNPSSPLSSPKPPKIRTPIHSKKTLPTLTFYPPVTMFFLPFTNPHTTNLQKITCNSFQFSHLN
ncbi:hypothetical protein GEMRC1_006092 [Eukaryota sp. GEM-RC1]